jgi:hypothetical protein
MSRTPPVTILRLPFLLVSEPQRFASDPVSHFLGAPDRAVRVQLHLGLAAVLERRRQGQRRV